MSNLTPSTLKLPCRICKKTQYTTTPSSYTYYANGNVLTFGNKEYIWNTGRNLESITDGSNTYNYTYDEEGIRTSKTVNGVTTYYNTKDGIILSQTDGTDTMYFQYDTNGIPLGFTYNGVQYLYLTNQMGDVFAVAQADGDVIAAYEYDEWGKLLYTNYVYPDNAEQVKIIDTNPLRYRGYYYDAETGYYYLQSRYYDPSICRFINEDDYNYIDKNIVNGLNLFSYCCNNPTNNADYSGYCFYNSFGYWSHDNWEFIGNYKRKFDPYTKFKKLSSSAKTVLATICGEAIGQGVNACEAVAWVMANRIGKNEWKNQKSLYAVATAKNQFNGYKSSQYKAAMKYFNNREKTNKRTNKTYEKIIAAVMPIYNYYNNKAFKRYYDFSKGAQFFYSPYISAPSWTKSKKVVKVKISCVSEKSFLFYKYKK